MPAATDFKPCAACGALSANGVPVSSLRSGARESLDHAGHGLDPEGVLCAACFGRSRIAYLTERLAAERQELTALERDAVRKAALHETIASRVDEQMQRTATRGQRIADAVARVGGSWPFVTSFVAFLAVWIVFNSLLLRRGSFDPYPYILLNLLLSCVAALQAPIIMMSQNRSTTRDRAQADQDYRVNLKAELEILGLHEKLDHLLHTRWENLIEMQETQLELLRSLVDTLEADRATATRDAKPASPAGS